MKEKTGLIGSGLQRGIIRNMVNLLVPAGYTTSGGEKLGSWIAVQRERYCGKTAESVGLRSKRKRWMEFPWYGCLRSCGKKGGIQ